MQVGDLVQRLNYGGQPMPLLGIVLTDGKRHVKVFWNDDYGTFWTDIKLLARLSNNEK
jgi:hypothetical protein